MTRVERDFFARDTLLVAKELLGNVLCRRIEDKVYRSVIVETEAYTQDDPACHAYKGVTKRSKTLFSKPGTAYVYLIYGMYHCVNFVTFKEGYGSGVLIRAVEPVNFEDATNGPGRLTRSLRITKELDGCDMISKNSSLWLEYGNSIEDENVVQTTRIGLKYGKELLRRFYVKDNKWVSKK